MNRLQMGNDILSNLYNVSSLEVASKFPLGNITEKDKFIAAKQILLGLAILYVLTLVAYLIHPSESSQLMDICTTTFPPLATLILVSYFKEKH